MNPAAHYSGPAKRDIAEISEYLDDRNPDAAERFLTRLDTLASLLASQPGVGSSQEKLGPGIRASVIRGFRYVIYYKTRDNGIYVVRVLHGARDLSKGFPDE